jgi:hypothetical protein
MWAPAVLVKLPYFLRWHLIDLKGKKLGTLFQFELGLQGLFEIHTQTWKMTPSASSLLILPAMPAKSVDNQYVT